MNLHEPIHFTLPNGIRVIHLPVQSDVTHCGLFIHTGSRDENEQEHGIAHFIEHCVFKGTSHRKAFHILTRMEDVGGEINAYTTKEETCLYASFTNEHLGRAMDLLTDIAFHSVFPEKEIAKEKSVIVDEINSYKDSPSEEINDRFEELVYRTHSLGHDILGTPKHLKQFDAKAIHRFINRTWNTDEMVFSVVGNVKPAKLKKLCDTYLSVIPANHRSFERKAPEAYSVFQEKRKRRNHQAHLMLGAPAFGVRDERRSAMILLNNLLGGPGMSSRLNLSIREKYGFTYNIDSSYAIYTDTGLWSVYLGTEADTVERCEELVRKELRKLRETPLSTLQLHKAKTQLKGQIAIAQESNQSLMLGYAKTFLLFNKIDSFQEICHKIDRIEATELREIANEVFAENQISTLLFSNQ